MCWTIFLLPIVAVACNPDSQPSAHLTETNTTSVPVELLPTSTEINLITPTVPPFTDATPAIVIESSPWGPTETPQIPAIDLPPAALFISQPGPGSYLHSPIKVVGWGGPSYNERVHIRLLGEDGRELTHYITYLMVYPGKAGRFIAFIYFEIDRLAEAARLEVSTESPRNQSVHQLSSVNVTLLSKGSLFIRRALSGPEKITILSPGKNSTIEGGGVLVEGAAWLESESPLTVELLDMQDKVLDSKQIWLETVPGQLGTFEAKLSYDITNSQYARVVVYESGKEIPGIIHLSSVEVWLIR